MNDVTQEEPVTTEARVTIQLTDKYDNYRVGLAQYNAGESVSVTEREAERLVREGAAVRLSSIDADAHSDKAPTHPSKNKMQERGAIK